MVNDGSQWRMLSSGNVPTKIWWCLLMVHFGKYRVTMVVYRPFFWWFGVFMIIHGDLVGKKPTLSRIVTQIGSIETGGIGM